MANTYTQLHNHIIFATKFRDGLIDISWQEDLHKYISGIIQNNDHKMLQINSVSDHVHMLIGLRPHQSLSSLMQTVKSESSKWVKDQSVCKRFAWQEGFGAFSNSKSQLSQVIMYIQHQQEHHRKKTFREEYIQMLTNSGIEFDEKYIFNEPV